MKTRHKQQLAPKLHEHLMTRLSVSERIQVPVTHPWKRGEAKGLPPTTASLNLSLKEPRPVPPMLS